MANTGMLKTSLEEYVSNNPKNPEARYQLALQYIKSKLDSQAEEQLRTCMELSPVGTELHTNCIQTLRQISESRLTGKNSGAATNGIKAVSSVTANSASQVSSGGTKTYGALKKSAAGVAPSTSSRTTPITAVSPSSGKKK